MRALVRIVLLAVLAAGAWFGCQAVDRHRRETRFSDRVAMLLLAKATHDEQRALALWATGSLRPDEEQMQGLEVPFTQWWAGVGIDRPADWKVESVELHAGGTARVTVGTERESRAFWVKDGEALRLAEE